MGRILLLGAGFSRNWGGWLATEVFEYLFGQVDPGLKELLLKHKRGGGFETALAELQVLSSHQSTRGPEQRLTNLQNAILQMFEDLNGAFSRIVNFEFQNEREYQVHSFLVKFDAIFTLNQDLLLERHYLYPPDNIALSLPRRWDGGELPGMKRNDSAGSGIDSPNLGSWTPDEDRFKVSPRLQPYFKLHGSSNWIDSSSQELLVMGGNKASAIDHHPILKWYHKKFREYLSPPDRRLMVIGYGFGDDHINSAISAAVAGGNLSIFVIDPLGVDVIDKNRDVTIYAPDQFASALWPHVIGASRRSLQEIFGADRVEHGKVMRFLS